MKLKHHTIRKRVSLKIKNQLYLVYLLGILIPISIVGCYLMLNTHSLLIKHHKAQMNSDNIRVKSILLDTTISVKNIADEIFEDSKLQEILSQTYYSAEESDKALRSYDKFKKYIAKHSEISSIKLYTTNYSIHTYGDIIRVTPAILNSEWFAKASNTARFLWRTETVTDTGNNSYNELSLSYRIPVTARGDYAVLVINISNNYLKSRINNNTFKTILSVNNDPIFYGNKNGIAEKLALPIDYNKKYYTYSGEAFYYGKDSLVELSTLVPLLSQDKLYITTIDTQAMVDTRRITLICLGILIFSIVVPFTIVIFFTDHFSKRINTLRSAMHMVSSGDYNIINNFTGNDELSEVYKDLTVMITSIKEMDKEIYESKISKQKLENHQQKMEFEMLSSQINPHFLYNTLETIRMKALSNNDREVANSVKLLGKYMRHNLESTGTTTSLQLELYYIEIYLTIQKLRFENKINFSITVEPVFDTNNYYILSLLIQPIVENSIIHGLEEVEEGGQIDITVTTDAIKDQVIISVSDNGIGLTQEELTALMNRIHSKDKKVNSSIGLFNIYQRIKLCYGEEYGLDIISSIGNGTTVKLLLPLHYSWRDL